MKLSEHLVLLALLLTIKPTDAERDMQPAPSTFWVLLVTVLLGVITVLLFLLYSSKKRQYVTVASSVDGKAKQFRTERDGTLMLSTIHDDFPHTTGLEYKVG